MQETGAHPSQQHHILFASDETREKVLKKCMRAAHNQVCFDCGAKDVSWASTTIAVFLCINCAAQHRRLGRHITFVRSCDYDRWTVGQLSVMRIGGNKKAREALELNGCYNSSTGTTDYAHTALKSYADSLWAAFAEPENNEENEKQQQELLKQTAVPVLPSRTGVVENQNQNQNMNGNAENLASLEITGGSETAQNSNGNLVENSGNSGNTVQAPVQNIPLAVQQTYGTTQFGVKKAQQGPVVTSFSSQKQAPNAPKVSSFGAGKTATGGGPVRPANIQQNLFRPVFFEAPAPQISHLASGGSPGQCATNSGQTRPTRKESSASGDSPILPDPSQPMFKLNKNNQNNVFAQAKANQNNLFTGGSTTVTQVSRPGGPTKPKGIGSEDFAQHTESASEHRHNIERFSNSQSISSAEYFNRAEDLVQPSQGELLRVEMRNVARNIRQGAQDLKGKAREFLSEMAQKRT